MEFAVRPVVPKRRSRSSKGNWQAGGNGTSQVRFGSELCQSAGAASRLTYDGNCILRADARSYRLPPHSRLTPLRIL